MGRIQPWAAANSAPFSPILSFDLPMSFFSIFADFSCFLFCIFIPRFYSKVSGRLTVFIYFVSLRYCRIPICMAQAIRSWYSDAHSFSASALLERKPHSTMTMGTPVFFSR